MFPGIVLYMRDEKEERSKQGKTNNKAKQNSTPKARCLGWDSNPRHSTLSLALPAISHSLLSMYMYMYVLRDSPRFTT